MAGLYLFSLVFSPGGHAAPDMPLLFVDIQHLPHLPIKGAVVLGQPLGNVLMYRGFGNSEMLCGGTDCRAGFNHVHSQLAGSVFDGI